ncbi:MAG: hypothetical protein HQ521_22170 [Bacteroidetes bacterium]|nr:hypothetical protein [Bacteroidota bacterium]
MVLIAAGCTEKGLDGKDGTNGVDGVYRGFEPELELVNCNCPTNECKRINICPTKDLWFDLNSRIKQIMKISTLDKLEKDIGELIIR